MSKSIVFTSNIVLRAIPPLGKQQMTQGIEDFQSQHYSDHENMWFIASSMQNALASANPNKGIEPIISSLQPLQWDNEVGFRNFLAANIRQHELIYGVFNKIALELVDLNYGKNPILFNFWLNPVTNFIKYDAKVLNDFLFEEYRIHTMIFRGITIMENTFNNTPIPAP